MSKIRRDGTIRDKPDKEFKECSRCKKTKDVIMFPSYWYQPKLAGEPYGKRVRRRMACCKDCTAERSLEKKSLQDTKTPK